MSATLWQGNIYFCSIFHTQGNSVCLSSSFGKVMTALDDIEKRAVPTKRFTLLLGRIRILLEDARTSSPWPAIESPTSAAPHCLQPWSSRTSGSFILLGCTRLAEMEALQQCAKSWRRRPRRALMFRMQASQFLSSIKNASFDSSVTSIELYTDPPLPTPKMEGCNSQSTFVTGQFHCKAKQ